MNHSTLTPGLRRLGYTPFFYQQALLELDTLPDPSAMMLARVVSEHRGAFGISDGEREYRAAVAGRLASAPERPCIGDFVLARAAEPARIERCLERQSVFRRRMTDGSSRPQAIAANVDLALIVSALAPEGADPHALQHGFNVRRIERYLFAVHEARVRPLVVVNKVDLRNDAADLAERLSREAGGLDVQCVSALQGTGVEELRARIPLGSTAVLVGSSGVGKSSLLNALLGTAVQRTAHVREQDTRGRHTTTHRELFLVPDGGALIDTPGMRELGVFAEHGDANTAFEDIAELSASCRFTDCRHHDEPGCAVLNAIDHGELRADRLEHYVQLTRELDWQRARYDVHERRKLRNQFKTLIRSQRSRLREKGRT